MKQGHYKDLKFHTIYSVILSATFLAMLLIVRDISLAVAAGFLGAYVIGNGIIHAKNNELSRDTLIEYILVSVIVIVVIVGTLL